ncbi:MAG: ferritin family protein [Bacteroidales bacterium]
MKKILCYLSMAIAMVGMISCTPKQDKTIANLKAAIDGEATASAKYAAFAEQAAKDSLFAVEALFKATSQAEAIHIKNHQEVLATLGVKDYQPNVQTYEVKTTAENLQAAIDGETYEFSTMYPGFIKDAEAEKVQGALVSFNYAQDAEKGHAKIYADVLAKLSTPEMLAAVYYVCPKCGNTYANTPSEVCELCQTASDQFIVFNANLPVVSSDSTMVATAKVVK